ncbi:hypothetical protein NHQ30_009593 [Ciborinia camelliae]|nr:hypothetical protein NHQ30_009593 [Ciborinia camelliae]
MTQSIDPAEYANLPAGSPPPGVQSNFDNPVTLAPAIHVAMVVSLSIAAVFLILRSYTKLFVAKMWGADDWTCLPGFVLILAHNDNDLAFTIMGPGKCIGIYLWDIRAIAITKAYPQEAWLE